MKCLCPKCSSNIEVDEPASPEKGDFAQCPECKARFWRNKENFILRVYKKDWKIFCDHCGSTLGPDTFCGSCAHAFPDYWVVQASKPAKKPGEKTEFSFNLPVKKQKKETRSAPRPRQASLNFPELIAENKKLLIKLAGVLGVAVLLACGGWFYMNDQAEKAFCDNFARTLYGIQSGSGRSLEKLDQIVLSGHRLSDKDISELNSIKDEVDGARKRISEPPGRFADPAQKLSGFYNIYTQLHNLAVSTSEVSPELTEKIKSLQGKYSSAETKLPQGLPEELMSTLRAASVKYRSLQPLVNKNS